MRDYEHNGHHPSMKPIKLEPEGAYPAIYYRLVAESGIDPVVGPPELVQVNQFVNNKAPAPAKANRRPAVRKAAPATRKAGLASVQA